MGLMGRMTGEGPAMAPAGGGKAQAIAQIAQVMQSMGITPQELMAAMGGGAAPSQATQILGGMRP